MIDLNLILKAIFAVIVYGGMAYIVSSFGEAMAWRREYERFMSGERRGEYRRFKSRKSLKEFERDWMDLNPIAATSGIGSQIIPILLLHKKRKKDG